jgi:hypothetical protein
MGVMGMLTWRRKRAWDSGGRGKKVATENLWRKRCRRCRQVLRGKRSRQRKGRRMMEMIWKTVKKRRKTVRGRRRYLMKLNESSQACSIFQADSL